MKGAYKIDVALSEKEKNTTAEKAHNTIVLSLGDKVLRQVSKEKTADIVWTKHEGFHMKKSLVNRLYLEQAFYSFRMSEDKPLAEQLDMFNKLILNLENIEVKIDDDDQVLLLLLLFSLPKSHVNSKKLFCMEEIR